MSLILGKLRLLPWFLLALVAPGAVAGEVPDVPPEPPQKLRMVVTQELPGLHWSNEPLQVQEKKVKGTKRLFVTLRGVFKEKNTDVLWGTHKIAVTQDHPKEFSITVPIQGVNSTIQLRSINDRGTLHSGGVTVIVPDYVARIRPPPVAPSQFRFSGSVGFSGIQYNEGTRIAVSMVGLTVKGQITYQWVPNRWDMAGSFYVTALPLVSNHPSSMRFLGLNFRIGYVFGFIPSPWSVSLMAGGYYTTMFVAGNNFGFADMTGPQLFPVVKYNLNPKHVLIGYAKYSPIIAGAAGLNLGQREIATGLTYLTVLSNNRTMTLSADLSNLALNIDGLAISSTSLSLSVGYGL